MHEASCTVLNSVIIVVIPEPWTRLFLSISDAMFGGTFYVSVLLCGFC